jgi:hypothetical protein
MINFSVLLLITYSNSGTPSVKNNRTADADKYIGKKGFLRVSPRQDYKSALRQEQEE